MRLHVFLFNILLWVWALLFVTFPQNEILNPHGVDAWRACFGGLLFSSILNLVELQRWHTR